MKLDLNFEEGFGKEEIAEISKNVNNILAIPEMSLPLMRGVGTDWGCLSQPPPSFESEYTVDVVEKIETYEPRVAVDSVEFEYDEDGGVEVSIKLVKGESE